MVEEDDLIQGLATYLIGLYVLMVIIILVLNNILLRKIWKPFYHSITQLKTFKIETDDHISTQSTSIEEFRLLNEAITKLIKKSKDSYTEQKQFIENASHELQTPLAISINKLELFLENNPLGEAQTQALSSVLDNLGRLTRLNKSLLLLSKIENQQFTEEHSIDFVKLTQEVAQDFKDLATHKQSRIQVDTTAPLVYNMNEDLAVILLTNLIKNAIVHGTPKQDISIHITSNIWSISNSADVGPLHKAELFSRFKKISTHKKSSGLGLAIAKAISDKYNLSLVYRYDTAHTFDIQFPQDR